MFTISQDTYNIQITVDSGADLDIHVSYTDFEQYIFDDFTTTQISRQIESTQITSAGTYDIVSAPAAFTKRVIDKISIRNIDGATTNNIFLFADDGVNTYKITPTIPLATNELYEYESGSGWVRVDAQGLVDTTLDIKLYYGTSANSLTISAGVQTFDTQAGLGYVEGQRIRLTNAQDYYMEGVLTSYVGNAMSVTVDYRTGSGTYSSWTLSPTSEQRVPEGGATGEVLTKNSATNYDASWTAVSGGPGGGDNSDYNNSFFLMGG